MKKLVVVLLVLFTIMTIPQSVIAQDKPIIRYKDFGGVGGNRTLTFYDNGTILFDKLVISPQIVTTLPIKLTNDTWGVRYSLTASKFIVNIYFDFRLDKRIKITINGTSNILFQLPLLKIVSLSATSLLVNTVDIPQVSIGDVAFNWEDSTSGLWNSETSTVSFLVTVGTFTIDPYLIVITTASASTQYPFQRKTFEAVTRYWAWFTTNTTTTAYLSYSSSADSGVTWATPTQLRTCTSARQFSVATNGTHVAYVWVNDGTYGADVFFRLGTLNSDGTITWAAVEQVAVALASITNQLRERGFYPSI